MTEILNKIILVGLPIARDLRCLVETFDPYYQKYMSFGLSF